MKGRKMDREQQKMMALEMVRKKIGFTRLEIDAIGRAEIWFGGCKSCDEIDNHLLRFEMPALDKNACGRTWAWIDVGWREEEGMAAREKRVWKKVLKPAGEGNEVFFYEDNGHGIDERKVFVPRFSTVESLLIENDLSQE